MIRIIAIVVVIAAAVVAYMYTSAGDVEVGEVATAPEPSGEPGESISPDDAVVATNPAQEEALDDLEVEFPEEGEMEGDALLEEARESLVEEEQLADDPDAVLGEVEENLVEEELIEGDLEAGEAELATEAEVLDDTAETVPAEEGPADDEPDVGVGAVSTEEETDGAGIEGIVAEEGEQEGLPGEIPEEGADTLVEPVGDGEPLETPEGLDTTNENAPEAVVPGQGNEAEAAAADAADGPVDSAAPGVTAVDPGPAIASEAATTVGPAVVAGGADDLDVLLDPENLDVEAVTAAIEGSDLEPAQQIQLIEALETAQGSPTQLAAVLDRIRTALEGE